jgi:hypothetical protein
MTGILDAPPAPYAVMITDDHGGRADYYAMQLERFRFEGRYVYIAGTCTSACTMALSLSTVCVYPWARLGFHAGRNAYSMNGLVGGALSPPWLQAWLWSYYSPAVQARLGGFPIEMRYLSGAELISLGIRDCRA